MKIIQRKEAQQAGLSRYFTGELCIHGHTSERITVNGCCHECVLAEKQARRAKKPGYRTRQQLDAIKEAPTRVCDACGETFPATSEYFVLVKNKKRDWEGLSNECRECRNKRYYPYYKKNRKKLIKRAIKSTRKRRLRPEVQEKNRIDSRTAKRIKLSDPIERDRHNKYGRKWRRNNPDKARKFKHAQPAYRRMRAAKRYAAKLNACPPWADQKKIETIYLIADYLTKKIGIEYQVDHIYPLMHPLCSGLHVPWNLRVITAAANQSKGNRLPATTGA